MKAGTCLVIDLWEGNQAVDFDALKNNGVSGVGIRLNDINGGLHSDKMFPVYWEQAKDLIRFPYEVYNPWVTGQANFDWLAAHIPAEARSVAADIEVVYPGYSSATYAAEVAKFINLCKAKWKTIIYTGQWFLPNLSSWPKNVDYWWAQYPLPSIYFSDATTWAGLQKDLDSLVLPFNFSSIPGTLKLWQVGETFKLPGTNDRTVDANIFYGSESDLAAYFGSAPVVVPPPDPDPAPALIEISVGPVTDMNSVLIPQKMNVTVFARQSGIEYTFQQIVDQTPVTPPPPPPPVDTHNYYKVLDDIEAGRTVRNGLPSTVRFHSELIATGKPGAGYVILSDALMRYAVKINDNGLGALKYQFADFNAPLPTTFKDSVGWHNTGNAHRVEELTFSGNIVDVLRIEGNKAYVKCLYNGEPAPIEYILPPVQMFTIQYSNHLDIDGNGKQPRTFIVANPGEELWIDTKDLKKV